MWTKRRNRTTADLGVTDKATPQTSIPTVYWRPGCPYCGSLFRSLDRLGVTYDTRNVWEDAGAAAFVRSVAGGNETVPTVSIGSRALVNPRPQEVLVALTR